LADALSRLQIQEGQGVESFLASQDLPLYVKSLDDIVLETGAVGLHESGTLDHNFSILVDDDDLLDCFLNYPDVTATEPFALDFMLLLQQQQQEGLHQLVQNDPQHYAL
jgi:hypothetical protein